MVWILIAGICRQQSGSMTEDGIYLLAADIATEGVEWTPIGDARRVQAQNFHRVQQNERSEIKFCILFNTSNE